LMGRGVGKSSPTVRLLQAKGNALIALDQFLSIFPRSQRKEGIMALWQAGVLVGKEPALLIEINEVESA